MNNHLPKFLKIHRSSYKPVLTGSSISLDSIYLNSSRYYCCFKHLCLSTYLPFLMVFVSSWITMVISSIIFSIPGELCRIYISEEQLAKTFWQVFIFWVVGRITAPIYVHTLMLRPVNTRCYLSMTRRTLKM